MRQKYLSEQPVPQYPLKHPIARTTWRVKRMYETRKIVIAGILIAIAIGLAYPLAVSALSMSSSVQSTPSNSASNSQPQSVSEDSEDHEDGCADAVSPHVKAWDIAILRAGSGHGRHELVFPKTPKLVLSAIVNLTSVSGVQNVSAGDMVDIVLTKKGGNYSALLLVKAKSSRHVYHAMVNVTSVTIDPEKISIDGVIHRTNVPGFSNGTSIHVEIMIGSASISSGSAQLSGNILGLIFKR